MEERCSTASIVRSLVGIQFAGVVVEKLLEAVGGAHVAGRSNYVTIPSMKFKVTYPLRFRKVINLLT